MSSQAFIEVSDIDHDILSRAVVELKLDRQNCLMSQRFFSEDVQKILTRCNSMPLGAAWAYYIWSKRSRTH